MSTLIGRVDGQHASEKIYGLEIWASEGGVEIHVITNTAMIDITRAPERARALSALLEVAANTVEHMRDRKMLGR